MAVGHWHPETSKRIFRELRLVDDSLPEGFTLEPWKPCDLSSWRGTFPGPIGTPYEGGAFEVNIQLPEVYWVVPPRVTFLTKVWHPNVSSTNGSTCLFTTEWSGALTLPKMLLCAFALLGDVAPPDESPHDTVVAAQYVEKREMFERTARDWTRRYAKKTGKHHRPEIYFAPTGWGEGEFGESTFHDDVVKGVVLRVLNTAAVTTRERLHTVLGLIDAHTESLPENAYICIAKELKLAYDSTSLGLEYEDDEEYVDAWIRAAAELL